MLTSGEAGIDGIAPAECRPLREAEQKAHKAYIDGLNWPHFDPAEFLEGISRGAGTRLGTTYAAPFEVFTV